MIRLDDEGSPTQRKAGAGACTQHKTHPVKTPQQDPTERLCMLRAVPAKGGVKEEGDKTSRSSHTGHDHTGKQQAAPSRPERAPAQTRHKRGTNAQKRSSRRRAAELRQSCQGPTSLRIQTAGCGSSKFSMLCRLCSLVAGVLGVDLDLKSRGPRPWQRLQAESTAMSQNVES